MNLDTVERKFSGGKGVIVATGPSITKEQLDLVQMNSIGYATFTLNNVYQLVPWTNVHVSCDEPWWQHYGSDVLKKIPRADKWTYHANIKRKHPELKLIGEAWGAGLSTDPQYIHIGHSSGFMALNLAYLYGCTEILLLGYDMTYPKAYNGHKRDPGGDRHYFGEYPPHLRHWPTRKVGLSGKGHLDGLIEMYETIDEDALGIKIYNVTPGSVLECFEKADLRDVL